MKLRDPATLFVAISHMTWSSLHARMQAGQLPALSAMMDRGVRARIVPPASDAAAHVWATVATGTEAARHGVLCGQEAWAGGLRPTGRQSWRAAPFWERLEAAGVPTLGVGWPMTRPGAEWSGIQVDERLGEPHGAGWNEWLLPRDVAPASAIDLIGELRVHPTDITATELRPFVPELDAVDQYRDRRLVDIALAIARFSTDYAAFTALVGERPVHVASLHIDILHTLLARFETAGAPFDAVVDAAWALIDEALGLLARRLPQQATFVVFSPGRTGEAGVMVAAGPSLTPGTELSPLSLLDIAPSLLARYGLADANLSGRARLSAPRTMRAAPAGLIAEPPCAPDPADLDRVKGFGFAPPQVDPALQGTRLLEQAELLIGSDPAAARRLANEALILLPRSGRAIGILAAAFAGEEDFTAFPQLADRLEAISPEHIWVPLIRAGYHASRAEHADAEPLLRDVEKRGGPLDWIRAAAAWLMLKRPIEARRLFGKVVDRWPDSTAGLIGLGMTHDAASPQAESAYRRVLELEPANTHALQGLQQAQLLRSMKDTADRP